MSSGDALGGPHGLSPGEVEYHLLTGLVVDAWERVEDELFRLCGWALDARPEQVAVIFGCVPAVDARLAVTDGLLRTAFDTPSSGSVPRNRPVAGWAKLCSRISALIAQRQPLMGEAARGELHRADGVVRIITLSDGTTARVARASALAAGQNRAAGGATGQRSKALALHLEAVRLAATDLAAFHPGVAAPAQPAGPRPLRRGRVALRR